MRIQQPEKTIQRWIDKSEISIDTFRKADNILIEDDDFDRRPQRRRYEEPMPVRMRKQLLAVAESPLKRTDEEVYSLAKTVSDNYDDE